MGPWTNADRVRAPHHREQDIRFIRLWFTDVLGTLKSVAVAPAELEGLRRRDRVRWVGDPGVRPRVRGRHDRQTRPEHLPDPAVARRSGELRACSATSSCPTAAPRGRSPVRPEAHLGQGSRPGIHVLHPPEIEFFLFTEPHEPGGPPPEPSTASAIRQRLTASPRLPAARSPCWSRWASR